MGALVATLLCASGHAGLELGLRTEGRERTAGPQEPPGSAADLQLDPSAALTLQDGDFGLSARYAPRLLWADAGGTLSRRSVLERGELTAAFRNDKTLSFKLGQRFSIGTTDFSLLQPAASAPLPPERLPSLQSLETVDSESWAEVVDQLSPRLRAEVRGGYFVAGGLTSEAQAQLPLQHGGRGKAQLFWRESRTDELGGALNLEHTILTTGRAVTVGELTSAWRSRLSRDTRSQLDLGAAFVRAFGGDSPVVQRDYRPVLGAGLEHDEVVGPQRLTGAIKLRLGPSIDRINGDVYQRAEGALSLELPATRDLVFAARGGAAVAVEGALRGQPLASSELEARYRLSPMASVAAGARAAWLGQGQGFASPGTQWVGYLAAVLGDRERL